MIEIKMSRQYGSGWKRWTVFAGITGLQPRVVVAGLAKGKAEALVARLKRLLKLQASSCALDRVLAITRRRGSGHGHWRVVLAGQRGDQGVWDDNLTRQAARAVRDELNPVLDTFREMRFEATVVDRLKNQLADNLLLQQRGEGPAVQVLIVVNNELRNRIQQLERGTHLQTRTAA